MWSPLAVCCARTAFRSPRVRFISTARKHSPVYILGTGNIGNLIAHSIWSLPEAPETRLLIRRKSVVDELDSKGGQISLQDGSKVTVTSGLTAELVKQYDHERGDGNEKEDIIRQLIVTTKTYQVVDALKPLCHRLDQKSAVLFLQNGMGVVSEVTERLFPDSSRRPQLLKGIISHGVHNDGKDRFVLKLAGKGKMTLELPPMPSTECLELYDTLRASPMLEASCVTPPQYLQASLDKLVMNATINPLTAIENFRNGELLKRQDLLKTVRELLTEMSEVFKRLPEVQKSGLPVEEVFSVDRLYGIVMDIAKVTGNNLSSTTQDIRSGRKTEIDYINGWIVSKAKDLGVDCAVNSWVLNMVKEAEAKAIGKSLPPKRHVS